MLAFKILPISFSRLFKLIYYISLPLPPPLLFIAAASFQALTLVPVNVEFLKSLNMHLTLFAIIQLASLGVGSKGFEDYNLLYIS